MFAWIIITIIAVMIPTTFIFAQTNNNDKQVVTIEMHDKTRSKDLLSYQVDFEGNILSG